MIDIVNHDPSGTANADVRHLNADEFDPYSTSLISTREIRAGGEVLLDYGAGPSGMTHERALLDFGFALPLHGPGYTAELPIEPLLQAAAPAVATEEAKYLRIYVTGMRRNVEPGWLRFDATGEPSVPTLALALACSFRSAEDLAVLVEAVDSDEAEEMTEEHLLARLVESSAASQLAHARAVLATAAEAAAVQIQTAVEAEAAQACDGAAGESFDGVAREYRGIVCEMLRRVVRRCGTGRLA